MKIKLRKYFAAYAMILPFLLFGGTFTQAGNGGGGGNKGKGNQNSVQVKAGDSYRMFINNLNMPMDKTGVIADVNIPDGIKPAAGGSIDNQVFLFSGGFFLSGLTNGTLWTNAVASASRIQDYVSGTVQYGKNDSRNQLYVLRAAEGDFSQSWIDWKDAVALGAYFYDGDGDGIYTPVDKNGNGKWDPEEDRPDLIGDETVWCVYNDGTDPALRRFNDVSPQGIEIRQTVFGFNSKSFVGNMLFVRYTLLNTGTVTDVLDSVNFGVWADPDLGDANDDLVGCDTTRNSGFVYNNGPDAVFGGNPPCFLMDFFQGPISYIPGVSFTDVNNNGRWDDGIDIAIDTAHNVQGQVRGIANYPGATNLGLSAFIHYMQSHPTHGDPNTRFEARNYMLGKNRLGETLNPCTWTFGAVHGGVNCALVDPKYSYSGDPVSDVGWINTFAVDQRQMSVTGPFKLRKPYDPTNPKSVDSAKVDVVIAYIVGRGENAKNSITVAKNYDDIAQIVFNTNFPSPPPPPPAKPLYVSGQDANGNGFIDIDWNTDELFKYIAKDTVLGINRRVHGFYINQYKAGSTENTINGISNVKEVAHYEMSDSIANVYTLLSNGNKNLVRAVADPANRIDSSAMANPATGRLRVRITADAFTGDPLIKGKPYNFTLTVYTLNHLNIFNKDVYEKQSGKIVYGPAGDYLARPGAFEEYATKLTSVVFGENMYSPAITGANGTPDGKLSDGGVSYVVVNYDQLSGNNYSLEFFRDTINTKPYSSYYKLRNTTTGVSLIDSSKTFDTTATNIAAKVTDGFVVKVKPVVPALGTATYKGTKWYRNFSATASTGYYYAGGDITGTTMLELPNNASLKTSTLTSADRMRKVKLVFGAANSGKAYRYLNGYIGSTLQRGTLFKYAANVTAADTVGKGPVGKLGEGFVDVPFTAWVIDDERYPLEKRQLATAFIEIPSTLKDKSNKLLSGKPDGIWDPGDTLRNSGEIIVIFDAPYDATGSQKEYTGGDFGGTTVWGDIIKGFTIPAADITTTATQKKIAASPFYNALYVVGLERSTPASFYLPGDTLILGVGKYPYSTGDKFVFQTNAKGQLTTENKKALFDKVNVFPNPLFGYNPATSYNGGSPDEPFVTFSNLPADVTVKIYTLSGLIIRTLTSADKTSLTSPFLKWNLKNTDGLRAASGMYLAIVSSPQFGDKVLKFGLIMPQKQIQRF